MALTKVQSGVMDGGLNLSASAPDNTIVTNSAGNVGIGTSSIQGKFNVGSGRSFFGANSETYSIGVGFTQARVSSGQTYYIGATDSTTPSLVFSNSAGTERMRIASNGSLLVGTTVEDGNSGIGVKIGSDGADGFCQIVGTTSNNANVTYRLYSTGAGAYRFYVGFGGLIYATSTSISALSDASLKTNVKDLETGLTEVMALKPRRFDWINGDAQNVAGFVAQEVEEVLPELVSDYQYNETETKKSLKMGDILPTLVKAIQEQQAIITDLKARIETLEAK